ncbi:MAG: glycoside hydrolase [Verrucomicrobiota bacterium]
MPSVLCGQAIRNHDLSFEAEGKSNTLVIKDNRTKRTWTADLGHCLSEAVITKWGTMDQAKFAAFGMTEVARLNDHQVKISVKEAQTGKTCSMVVTLAGPNVSFEVLAENRDAPFTAVGLPPMFTTDMKAGYLTFCDRSSGVLKKQDDTGVGYNETMLTVYGSTNCMNIPLVGLFDREHGDAMMLQIESPLDANVRLSRKAGLIWPEPVWQCSMGTFAYPRRATYRFIDQGGYVKMADLYRDYQKKHGMLKTLAEKANERPVVNRMRGSTVLWAEVSDVGFLKKWRNYGITRAILATEFQGAENRRWSDMGYITLGYDSYGDITEGPLGFQSDNIQENGLMLPTGEMMTGWTTTDPDGKVVKQYYLRSSSKYLNAAMAYSQSRIIDANRNGNFIDVMMAGGLMEDHHPQHTFDRKTDLQYKREVFQYYLKKGLVIGTEHGNDWGVDLVDYTEGGLSGSNWWIPGKNTSGWNAGHLRAPVSRDDFSPEFLKYGLPTQRIPFWELVYHDCVATTWYWGDSAGWFWKVAPEIKTMKDRITLLYGDMPLLWSEVKFDWKNDSAEHLETYYLTVPSMRDKFGYDFARVLDG